MPLARKKKKPAKRTKVLQERPRVLQKATKTQSQRGRGKDVQQAQQHQNVNIKIGTQVAPTKRRRAAPAAKKKTLGSDDNKPPFGVPRAPFMPFPFPFGGGGSNITISHPPPPPPPAPQAPQYHSRYAPSPDATISFLPKPLTNTVATSTSEWESIRNGNRTVLNNMSFGRRLGGEVDRLKSRLLRTPFNPPLQTDASTITSSELYEVQTQGEEAVEKLQSEQSTQYSPQVELPTRSFPTLASFFTKKEDELITEADKQIDERLQEELPERAVRFTEDALRKEVQRQKERSPPARAVDLTDEYQYDFEPGSQSEAEYLASKTRIKKPKKEKVKVEFSDSDEVELKIKPRKKASKEPVRTKPVFFHSSDDTEIDIRNEMAKEKKAKQRKKKVVAELVD